MDKCRRGQFCTLSVAASSGQDPPDCRRNSPTCLDQKDEERLENIDKAYDSPVTVDPKQLGSDIIRSASRRKSPHGGKASKMTDKQTQA